MNAFVQNIGNQVIETENGMKTFSGSGNSNVNFFSGAPSLRSNQAAILSGFLAAFIEDKELAIRNWLWLRDVRGGAGERLSFRTIALYLEQNHPEIFKKKLLRKFIELGRFDDLLIFQTELVLKKACKVYYKELDSGNALAFKWLPRKSAPKTKSYKLELIKQYLGDLHQGRKFTPKEWRQFCVKGTQKTGIVVENQICTNKWENINFEHVPSIAAMRYRTAFFKHQENRFTKYVNDVKSGKKKVNASTNFPHDIIKSITHNNSINKTELDFITEQWKAQPDYIESNESFIPLIDVSGSMMTSAGGTTTRCIDVALALGLYVSERNKSVFKDTFLTFSSEPELQTVKGNIHEKLVQISRSKWTMSTNLHKAFDRILTHAIAHNVSPEDMPSKLIIFSDMQFNQCVTFDDSAFEMIKRKYAESKYQVPQIVFWNLKSRGDSPVKFNKSGTALVGGYSPSLMKGLLSNLENYTPYNIMIETIMNDRYKI